MEMQLPQLLRLVFCISIGNGLVSSQDRYFEDGPGSVQGPEHELFKHIVEHYKPDSRPVRNSSDAVVVSFALSLNQLLDLDEKNQVLSTSVWIYEEWKDELLVWSAEDFDNQKTLMIPASVIWLPDIFIFNAAGDTSDGFVHVNGSKVAIESNGNVKWMVPLMVNSACAVDVTYFPYDRQTCTIKFGSWIYDVNQLDLVLEAALPDLDHYIMNSEYDLENVSLSRGIVGSSCCAGDGQHSIIELQIKLKRKSLYYDYIVIAPTIMLCVLTLASFLLPCDKGEKISIGLTVFLTLYVLQLRIADNVPDTNSTPILGVFMLVVMTFNCVSLIMATVVMNIKKRGDISQCPEVPGWLFTLCEKVIGPLVCTLWKNLVPVPIFLQNEVVEHVTTFDGPDFTVSDSKYPDNERTNEERSKSHVTWNEDDSMEYCNDDDDDDEVETEFRFNSRSSIGKKHVQFDKSRDDEGNITTIETVSGPAGAIKSDEISGNDMELFKMENQEKKELMDKLKTHHPIRKNLVRSSNDSKRLPIPDEHNVLECPNDDQQNIDFMSSETPEYDISSHSSNQSNPEGIRQRKRTTEFDSIESCDEPIIDDEQNFEEMNSFLPWSAADVPALKHTRRMDLRKRRWYYTAEVVDKFAFCVYLVLLTVSIFTVLFLIPVTFRKDDA